MVTRRPKPKIPRSTFRFPVLCIFEHDPDDLRAIADEYAELARFCEGASDSHPEVAIVQRLYAEIYERAAPVAAHYQGLKALAEGKKAKADKLSAKARVLLERIGEDP